MSDISDMVKIEDAPLFELGVTQKQIEQVRSAGPVARRIITGARIFADMGYSGFTFDVLVKLVHPGHKKSVEFALKKLYEEDARERSTDRAPISQMQVLRERTGNYHGNLQQAMEQWPLMEPSEKDWRNSHRLPLKIDRAVSQLLAVVLMKGSLASSRNKATKSLALAGSKKDIPLFRDYVLPAIKRIFAIDSHYEQRELTNVQRQTGESNREYYPHIWVHSKMVTTWLRYELGYAERGGFREILPNLPWQTSEVQTGFVEGIIATKLSVKKSGVGTFMSEDPKTLETLASVLDIADIPYTPASMRLSLDPYMTRTLCKTYTLLNPRHAHLKTQKPSTGHLDLA